MPLVQSHIIVFRLPEESIHIILLRNTCACPRPELESLCAFSLPLASIDVVIARKITGNPTMINGAIMATEWYVGTVHKERRPGNVYLTILLAALSL